MTGKTSKKSAKVAKMVAAKRGVAKPTLLTGDNPQIAKADGDAPVQAHIAAMPGWKRNVGRRLDALIVRTVCARRSNGTRRCTESRARAGSSASIASRTTSKWLFSAARRCVLSPRPSQSKDSRYLDIHEDDQLDEAQLIAWVKQASQLPGKRM